MTNIETMPQVLESDFHHKYEELLQRAWRFHLDYKSGLPGDGVSILVPVSDQEYASELRHQLTDEGYVIEHTDVLRLLVIAERYEDERQAQLQRRIPEEIVDHGLAARPPLAHALNPLAIQEAVTDAIGNPRRTS